MTILRVNNAIFLVFFIHFNSLCLTGQMDSNLLLGSSWDQIKIPSELDNYFGESRPIAKTHTSILISHHTFSARFPPSVALTVSTTALNAKGSFAANSDNTFRFNRMLLSLSAGTMRL